MILLLHHIRFAEYFLNHVTFNIHMQFVDREKSNELDRLMVEKFNVSVEMMMELAGYRLAEFIRDAIRSKLEEMEKQDALKHIAEMKGSLKGKSKMSDRESQDALAREYADKFGVDIE